MESPGSLTRSINQQLQISSRKRSYTFVQVLILYWEEGNKCFREEGSALGELFRREFHYDVEEFPIPTARSREHLQHFVSGWALKLEDAAQSGDGYGLLVIHYGGHGDAHDDRKNGEEQRSVWAAHAAGPPILEWYRIQDDLKDYHLDILLLLDCCFAAQAGRGRDKVVGKFELLVASTMGMKTPLPGPRSFTRCLMAQLEDVLHCDGHISIVDLHARLMKHEANLYATPVYAALNPGHPSISLVPLSRPPNSIAINPSRPPRSRFQVVFDVEKPIDEHLIGIITDWLGKAAPREVDAVEVESVLQTTSHIQHFVNNSLPSNQPLTRALSQPAEDNLLRAWHSLALLISTYKADQGSVLLTTAPDANDAAEEFQQFVERLDSENNAFLDALIRWLLNSPNLKNIMALNEAIDDPISAKLGIADQLKLRRTICSLDSASVPTERATPLPPTANLLQEYRDYGQYLSPTELPELERRISCLARLLSEPKDLAFLSLPCRGWRHETIRHRFVLEFDIPVRFRRGLGKYQSLYAIITESRGLNRPSLDSRFQFAHKLAKAVQKWHNVGWVHQGISSHNIVFLYVQDEKLDYSYPILQGFQYSRPKIAPSIGRVLDDMPFAIYRHPERQGTGRQGHTKIHDLYSLGVVLLEIGLWQSAMDIVKISKKEVQTISAEAVRTRLVVACQTRLHHYAGTAFQQAVQACLCSEFNIKLDDHEDSNLAAAYQKTVIERLLVGAKLTH